MDKEKDEAKFTIEGNPGQENTFIHIGTAYNVNPNAKEVNNTFNIYSREEGDKALGEAAGSKPKKKLSNMTLREMLQNGLIDTDNLQRDVLNYASRIRGDYFNPDYDKLYEKLWARIIEHEPFDVDLYDPGKQHCAYNRNLIANVIHYLNGKGFYKKPYNKSELARLLEDDEESSIRKALRFDPEPKYIRVVDEVLKDLKEEH